MEPKVKRVRTLDQIAQEIARNIARGDYPPSELSKMNDGTGLLVYVGDKYRYVMVDRETKLYVTWVDTNQNTHLGTATLNKEALAVIEGAK